MSRVTGNHGRSDGLAGVADDRAAALLAPAAMAGGAAELAELRIRRLANRHGCTRGRCPDPAAHERDVIGMTLALQAIGLPGGGGA